MDAREFLNQANLYEEVDANLLDRVYKFLMVSAVNHPLTIVRAREIVNWAETSEYRDIYEGRYPRTSYASMNGDQPRGTSPAAGTTTIISETELTSCPHCGREQTNRRFCSLCGSSLT